MQMQEGSRQETLPFQNYMLFDGYLHQHICILHSKGNGSERAKVLCMQIAPEQEKYFLSFFLLCPQLATLKPLLVNIP